MGKHTFLLKHDLYTLQCLFYYIIVKLDVQELELQYCRQVKGLGFYCISTCPNAKIIKIATSII